jgi:hypothetical protein
VSRLVLLRNIRQVPGLKLKQVQGTPIEGLAFEEALALVRSGACSPALVAEIPLYVYPNVSTGQRPMRLLFADTELTATISVSAVSAAQPRCRPHLDGSTQVGLRAERTGY